ncbi:non-ribosomal peptide synthetase [Amycolatopsis sp. NPDC005003]
MNTSSTLLDLFARSVGEFGDRAAVSDDERTLTYAALDHESTALACRLRAAGAGPGSHVAVLVRRGAGVVVAMLGILKAGAAYVMVDTRYPGSRRELLISAASPAAVLTEPGWESSLQHPERIVMALSGGEPVTPVPLPRVAPGDAACVLFTSGSSGAPKAVVLEHRNLVSFATNAALPALRPADRVGQISSVSFDAVHFEIWCAVAHGAEIVVLPPISDLLSDGLSRHLRDRGITALLAPTMAVNNAVRADPASFTGLRLLHTGGDVLQPGAAQAILAGGFTGELWNLYGPTEATTACTCHHVGHFGVDDASVPIGRPLNGVSVRVLDETLSPVPPGAVGELFVQGAGVARGYLSEPGLTAARFLPSLDGPPGSRCYATGDLVRFASDGILEFVGRTDDQVKIRGYRVEPAEVERALGRHPSVWEAVVLTDGAGDDRRLVAFVSAPGASPEELRDHAAEVLPDFMVPAVILLVPEIPFTDNGKRDVRELRAVLADHQSRAASYVAPRDECEQYLAVLWERLLDIGPIGRDDSFFGLGGNSLHAVRAYQAIREDLGVPIEFRELFDAETLADVAALLRKHAPESA